ncbi:hypothetical protein ACQEVG_32970 [Streptomyces sp. CA-135486]|uniref:hypothetical protein n=1 Tax=Streptomyces sp. CA-135486 TaxID=3240049 RepID=UPI003D8F4312
MTEYVAKCWADEADTITASVQGESVELAASSNGLHRMEAYLKSAKTREFARGLLALADEIDGGKATEPVKVGDTVRVLHDSANGASVRRGDTFVVRHVNDHEVQVDGNGVRGRWYLSLTNVEKVDAAPQPVKVGDRVTIVRGENTSSNGKTGIVDEIDDAESRVPYRIVDEMGDYVAWAAEVRKVDAPADELVFDASRVVVAPERVALLEEARKQSRPSASTEDVLAVARFLAGEQ